MCESAPVRRSARQTLIGGHQIPRFGNVQVALIHCSVRLRDPPSPKGSLPGISRLTCMKYQFILVNTQLPRTKLTNKVSTSHHFERHPAPREPRHIPECPLDAWEGVFAMSHRSRVRIGLQLRRDAMFEVTSYQCPAATFSAVILLKSFLIEIEEKLEYDSKY